jgi:hypothetical protein
MYIMANYVDDSILVGKTVKFVLKSKAASSNRFEIEDLGPTTWLSGCKIERDKDERIFRLSQEQYVTDVVEEFGMISSNPVGTPMAKK